MRLLPLLSLLPLLLPLLLPIHCTSRSDPPPSSPLDLSPFSKFLDSPYGTRLFLTSHPNKVNLVWCCDIPVGEDTAGGTFEKNTGAVVSYDGVIETNRTAANATEVGARYKAADSWTIGQYNTTLELRSNRTLHYRISCNGVYTAGKFEVQYKYWDKYDSNKDVWSLLAVGSLGLYNTTELALRTVKMVSENVGNVLWAIPGGLVMDMTPSNVSESEALVNWRAWIQLAENVTCCVPVAAAPSQLDLLPHKQDNQLQSYFRWFMELPFVSQDEEVLWYSFDHRNLHVVSICSYCDLSDQSPQFQWLQADLEAASSTNDTHWIMVLGHDPIYETDESFRPQAQTRFSKQLDKLLAKYEVDFAVWSHERWYERTKPMKNFTVTMSEVTNELDSVNGTIHYTCGTGGLPLHRYNMEKYNHTAAFLANHYGACGFIRVQDNRYESMFVHLHGDEVRFKDHITIAKDLPQPKPFNTESHFSRFMKVFGIVILIGAVIMLLITILVKAVQKHDPSFITDKIRNVKYRKEATQLDGSSEKLEVQEVEMDAVDLPSKKGDKVMLLEEIEEHDLQLSSAAQMYGVMM